MVSLSTLMLCVRRWCRFFILVEIIWNTVNTIGSTSPSTVRVYDSLGKALPLDTKKQVSAILRSPDKEIKLEYANVQVAMNNKNFTHYFVD